MIDFYSDTFKIVSLVIFVIIRLVWEMKIRNIKP